MKNRCNGWKKEEFSYICLNPEKRFEAKMRAWQGCPTVAVTKKGRLFAGWYTGGAFEPCIDNNSGKICERQNVDMKHLHMKREGR